MRGLRVPRAPPGTFDLVLNLTNRHIHAQLLDRTAGRVRLAVHTNERVIRRQLVKEANSHYDGYATGNVHAAERVGGVFAQRAADQGIDTVYWRAPGKYHGKIKAFIDAVRSSGITTLKPAPINTPRVPEISSTRELEFVVGGNRSISHVEGCHEEHV